MALISIKRNIDLQPGLNAPAVFNCSQSDKGTTIMLGLMNGGNDYTVPSGVTITIRGSRSNGAVFTPVSATSSGSTVSFTLTEEMTDTAGPTLCEAVLEQGNNVLGTANFIINVEGSPMGADVPPVFTDAAWTWMLGKLTTETVPALGDDVISSIQGKVDKSQGSTNAKKFLRVNTSGNVSLASTDKTLSVADQIADAKETGDQIRALDAEIDGVVTTLGGSISTLNGVTTDLQSSKLNKNQGTSNAGKTMIVDSSGNIVPGDVPITIDDTLSIADAAADAKAAGDAIALKANASTIAPKFSDQNTYTAGSYVLKNGVLYKFTAAHSGAWTGTDAEVVTVGGEVDKIIVRNAAVENHVFVNGTSKSGLYLYTGESVVINVTSIDGNVSAYIYGYTASNVLLLSQAQKYTFTAAHDGYISFYMSTATVFEASINLVTSAKTLLEAEEQNTIYNNGGLQTFKGLGNFQHYGLNPDGSFLTTQKYRVSNNDPITLDYPATLKIKSGFKFGYIPFYDGTAGSWAGWYTNDITIPYGVSFVLQIARTSERTVEVADVNEFLSALSFTSPSEVLLEKKESEKNGAFVRDFNSFEHERGNITSSGGDDESEYNHTRKLRSKGLVYLNKGDVVTASNSMRCYTVGVTLFGTAVNVNSGWITSTYVIPYSGYYRIQIGYANDSVIADKDITKICGWVTFTSNWLLGDGEVYKYFNDTLTAGRTYAYNGEMLNFNKTTYNINEVLPVLPAKPEGSTSLQASEYYNGVMFLFYSGGYVSLVDYATGALITSLSTGTEHGNAASFSNEFYESGDEFPLVYVASDNANNDIYVVRITRASATIIRTLRIPVSEAGYHASNFGLDIDNKLLWTTGYKINDYQTAADNGMHLCSWDLNNLTDNENGTYTPALVSKSELPFIDTTQDEKVFNGNLYVLSSNPYAGAQGRVSKIYVVSLNGRRISAILENFNEPIRDHELEGIIFIDRGNKYVMAVNVITGRRFELSF